MSTQLTEHNDHWVVATVQSLGKRRKRPRLPVSIPKGDPAALRAEIIKQGEAARLRAGLSIKPQEPVA